MSNFQSRLDIFMGWSCQYLNTDQWLESFNEAIEPIRLAKLLIQLWLFYERTYFTQPIPYCKYIEDCDLVTTIRIFMCRGGWNFISTFWPIAATVEVRKGPRPNVFKRREKQTLKLLSSQNKPLLSSGIHEKFHAYLRIWWNELNSLKMWNKLWRRLIYYQVT